MIDEEGYRQNVGIVLCNKHSQVLWARRIGQDAWQFPQGGILSEESPEQALFRELWEEIGLAQTHVEILASTPDWLRYRLPRHLIRHGSKPLCIGQKQIWFLLRLIGDETHISLDQTNNPEFDDWRWVDFWHPLNEVVSFKRDVYESALSEFAPLLGQHRHPHSAKNR
ncbi:MAG: RNA pyrophosphohydrolase [Gammaproteobacteria bacterium]|nr:RNA pyrophosphohydrolase [Gammaproteobacteria bacterium]